MAEPSSGCGREVPWEEGSLTKPGTRGTGSQPLQLTAPTVRFQVALERTYWRQRPRTELDLLGWASQGASGERPDPGRGTG